MITIAHLYYDLLNLYGESGNVKALKTALETAGIDVTVKLVTTDDTLNFSEYDFVYIGTGTEENQILALNHLLKYKEDIKKAINEGTFFLATGNAMELFGKYIINQYPLKGTKLFENNKIFLLTNASIAFNCSPVTAS